MPSRTQDALSALERHESRDVPPDDAAGHRGRGSRPHFGRPCRRVAPRQRPDSGSFHETGLKRPSRVVPERFELFDADGLIGGPSDKKARLSVPCGRESRLSNDSLGNGSSRGKREKDGAKSIASSSSERLELFRLAELLDVDVLEFFVGEDGGHRNAVFADGAAVHAEGVHREGEVALGVENDHAARALDGADLGDGGVTGLLNVLAEELVVGMHVVGGGRTDEHFARARAGNGHRFVVGVGAGPDDGRVAHAAEALVGHAARRRARGNVAVLVERHGADRAVFVVVHHRVDEEFGIGSLGMITVVVENDLFLFLGLLELLIAEVREEPLRIDGFGAVLRAELFGALRRHHDVRRLGADEVGAVDGVLHVGYARNGAGGERLAVHDGRVEFVLAFAREDRAAAGVEVGIEFHLIDGGLDGVDGCTALFEHGIARLQSLLEAFVVLRGTFGREVFTRHRAGAAVNDETNVGGLRRSGQGQTQTERQERMLHSGTPHEWRRRRTPTACGPALVGRRRWTISRIVSRHNRFSPPAISRSVQTRNLLWKNIFSELLTRL